MDYQSTRILVSEEIHRYFDERVKVRPCPSCKQDVTMLSVSFEAKDNDSWNIPSRWRCLGCLGLYEEKLQEVVT